MWRTGLVAPRHVGSSRTRARTRVPCIGRWILNHCATREILACFLIGLFVFLLLSFKSSLYVLDQTSIRCVFCKYFLPVCGLSCNSLDIVFYRAEVFKFNEVQFINYFFHEFVSLLLYLKSHCHARGHLDFLLCYLLGFL